MFETWMAAFTERSRHEAGCPPCLTVDPSRRCPEGRRLAETEQQLHHRWFQERFSPKEVSAP